MVDETRAGRRRQTIGRAASTSAVLLVAVTAVAIASPWLFSTSGRRLAPGGLGCRQVIEMLPAYAQKTLDADLMQRIGKHLDNCPHCRQIHQQQDEPAAGAETAPSAEKVAALSVGRNDK